MQNWNLKLKKQAISHPKIMHIHMHIYVLSNAIHV